jgi:DDE superfamily endonuclease
LIITELLFTNTKLSRPRNADELFNLRHASARNVIERIFGVLKWRFRILVHPPQFDMDIQARLPPALAALHNFICKHDPDDIADFDNVDDPQPGAHVEGPAAAEEGQLAEGLPRAAEAADQ